MRKEEIIPEESEKPDESEGFSQSGDDTRSDDKDSNPNTPDEVVSEDPVVSEVLDETVESEKAEEGDGEVEPKEDSADEELAGTVPVEKNIKADDVNVGDTIRLHYEIVEGGKSRIQPYDGLVIAKKGAGISRTIMVRRIARGGVGVERIFPVHSPLIKQVDILRKGKVRRSKLYYLRDRVGKGALRVKERK